MSVQYGAVASQKFTWPCFTFVDPAATVAVRVTRLPAFTEVTTIPPEVITSEVVVVVRANAEELITAVNTISAIFSNSNGRRATVLTDANWPRRRKGVCIKPHLLAGANRLLENNFERRVDTITAQRSFQ